MQWQKKGLIYTVEEGSDWKQSHAQVPTVMPVGDTVLRIYFTTRDTRGRTRPTFIEVDADDPKQVLYEHNTPLLDLSAPGSYDDAGCMASWIVPLEDRHYLYYVGYTLSGPTPYAGSVSLAISENGGIDFERMGDTAILDHSLSPGHLCATACVLIDGGIWRMWYLHGLRWENLDGRLEPFYHIRYAESNDGVHWQPTNIVCIDLKPGEGGLARPVVLKEKGGYKMWFCYRKAREYRINPAASYRISYAESADGLSWQRKDDLGGLGVSEAGWDSVMTAYPFVHRHKDQYYLFYNGNGFGTSGMGYAVSEIR